LFQCKALDLNMIKPPYPQNEAERVQVLRDLLILDTPPEERFDSITAYAHSRFEVEIALVSLVDTHRQWFKSSCGLLAKETSRDISFCGHSILHDGVMVVPDALNDPRFADNPLVLGPPNIRFYAGAPLKLSSGHSVGTLCIIDSQPKRLAAEEIDHLRVLAHMVSMELENQGRIKDCKNNCLYGHSTMTCPYIHAKHELPD
jgi:GAF domain-containing protein